MKVFEVLVSTCFNSETEVSTRIFLTRERANQHFTEECKFAKNDAIRHFDDTEIVIVDCPHYFQVYKDGNCDEWNVYITLEEKEVES